MATAMMIGRRCATIGGYEFLDVEAGPKVLVAASLGGWPDRTAVDGSSSAAPNISGAPSCRQKLSVWSA